MAVRLVVARYDGVMIGELEAEVGAVSWRLNDVGSAPFALASGDAKATEDMLRFGNLALLEFDNGLPNWGGTIEPPRNWQRGVIGCNALSAEAILGRRITDKGRYFDRATVGYIFYALLREANDVADTGIRLGSVWVGGDLHYPDYHFQDLLTIYKDSLCTRMSNADFAVTGMESGGKITFTANFYERRGYAKPTVVLMEDHNLTKVRLIEQGPIVNWWDLAGQGTDWSSDRIMSHAEDAASISTYGLRQDGRVYADVSIQNTLDGHATNLLAESKIPHNLLELETVSLDPAEYGDYDVGDSVRVMLHSYGFGGGANNRGYDGMVRVLAREYAPKTGRCKLVVEEE